MTANLYTDDVASCVKFWVQRMHFEKTVEVPDGGNLGRYAISPFSVTVDSVTTPIPYLAVVYQASGGQLFWLEDGADGQGSVFNGQIQQQSFPLGGDAKKAAAKTTKK